MTTWVEVRPAALTANAAAVASLLGPECALCAVVKANGYGHGAALAARAFLAGGAALLAVTTVDEAAELRQAGIDAELLLLASHAADEADTVVELGLTAALSNPGAARRLDAAARAHGRSVQVHLLVDTGMGRDGVLPDQLGELAATVADCPALVLDGAFTHFPGSIARDKAPTRAQLARFLTAVGTLPHRPRRLHAANSGAAVDVPAARLDFARVGTLLYGQYPSADVTRALTLQDTWALKAALVEVRRLPAGASVGYGSECRLARETLVGTLLVGWQHGFTLAPASTLRGWRGLRALLRPTAPSVTLGGVRCPVLGRVAMQSCAVDLSGVPGAAVGDVVSVPCRRVVTDRGLPRVAVD